LVEAVNNSIKENSIEEHVKNICGSKEYNNLDDWRGYYRRQLKPLDEKVLDLVSLGFKI
jgi:hypothetical protein